MRDFTCDRWSVEREAEGCQSGLPVTDKRDRTIAQAHDLARDGKSYPTAVAFGREEGNEDMGRHVVGDERTVVADVYHHRFVFVAVGADADISLRAYGLGGILEQVGHHTRYQTLIGIDEKVLRLHAQFQPTFRRQQRTGQTGHAHQKRFHIEKGRPGRRHMSELTVVLHKRDVCGELP